MNTLFASALALLLAAYLAWRLGGAAIGVLSPGSAATTKAKLKKTLTKIVLIGAATLFAIGLATEYVSPAIATSLTATGNWIADGAHNIGTTTTDNASTIGLWTLVIIYSTAAMWWIFRANTHQTQRTRTVIAIGVFIALMLGAKGLTYTT